MHRVSWWLSRLRIQHWQLLWFGSLLWHGFDPWPGNFHMTHVWPRKKKNWAAQYLQVHEWLRKGKGLSLAIGWLWASHSLDLVGASLSINWKGELIFVPYFLSCKCDLQKRCQLPFLLAITNTPWSQDHCSGRDQELHWVWQWPLVKCLQGKSPPKSINPASSVWSVWYLSLSWHL